MSTTSLRFVSPYRNPPKVRRAVTDEHRVTTAPPVLREVFGSVDEELPGPHAFLLEVFPAHSRFGAHFHSVDQFQVFYPSPGAWYQRSPIDEITCHYADAYTTYGPFGTEDRPMTFLTLRPTRSTLTAHMPGSRDKLRASSRRTVHVGLDGITPDRRRGSADVVITDVIPAHPDGLWAAHVDAAAGVELADVFDMSNLDRRVTQGQYHVVLGGTVIAADIECRAGSVGWAEPAGATVTQPSGPLRSGPDGATLLVLRFPAARVDDLA